MTQVSFFELFFVGLPSPLFERISNARWDWFFTLVLKYFFDFLKSQISLLVFVGASFVFKLKLAGAGNICNNWFEFHAQKCRQIIVNGHSYQWQVDTYHAHQRNQEWRHYIASSDFESGRRITKSLWIGWQLSLGVGPMGELDLEVGGRQKNTTNASIKQGKNHNFLTTMKAKKMKSTAVLFKLGYSYSVVLCLLSSWRRFFHWIASPNWSFNSVIWQNPRLKFVFRMRSCPWYL